MASMENPIPLKVRNVLYVLGIVVGGFVAIVLPDVLLALHADELWTGVAVRATGALTILLSTLARANLADPGVVTSEVKTVTTETVTMPVEETEEI